MGGSPPGLSPLNMEDARRLEAMSEEYQKLFDEGRSVRGLHSLYFLFIFDSRERREREEACGWLPFFCFCFAFSPCVACVSDYRRGMKDAHGLGHCIFTRTWFCSLCSEEQEAGELELLRQERQLERQEV